MSKLPLAFGAVLLLGVAGCAILPPEAIDRLRAAAGQLLRDSPAFQNLVREISAAR